MSILPGSDVPIMGAPSVGLILQVALEILRATMALARKPPKRLHKPEFPSLEPLIATQSASHSQAGQRVSCSLAPLARI